jgi:hypothetical protein
MEELIGELKSRLMSLLIKMSFLAQPLARHYGQCSSCKNFRAKLLRYSVCLYSAAEKFLHLAEKTRKVQARTRSLLLS